MLKSCAVPSCMNDSFRRPELSFYSFPRDTNARDEWLEQIGLKRSDSINLKICEVHFRPKDFCAGKRQLKTHALPVLKLGAGKVEPVNSDDEFMQCNSDSDPEILEVKKISAASFTNPVAKNKEKSMEKCTIKQEPGVEWECETTGRPSRRAARLAAKKIYNTVHNYGLGEVDDSDISEIVVPPKPVSAPRSYQRQRARSIQHVKLPPANIDLQMECHEELLSAAQAEALLKAQLEYNMVMKTLRSLKANNVRIICAPSDEPVQETVDQNSNLSLRNGGLDTSRKPPNVVTLTPLKNENLGIVPMELSSALQAPSSVAT